MINFENCKCGKSVLTLKGPTSIEVNSKISALYEFKEILRVHYSNLDGLHDSSEIRFTIKIMEMIGDKIDDYQNELDLTKKGELIINKISEENLSYAYLTDYISNLFFGNI